MPYLHWETDRRRERSAEVIRKVRKSKLETMGSVVDAARIKVKITTSNRVTTDEGLETITTTETIRPTSSQIVTESTAHGKTILGLILLRAAAVREAMDYDTDERLVAKYLDSPAPLHPRRTLDQSYYWTLTDTHARDRDQVIYRGTAPVRELMHTGHVKSRPKEKRCRQCTGDTQKVPRIIMVDQLWMFVLDES
jgi:hypothetical protein